MNIPLNVELEELYMLIGEREVIRFKQQKLIEALHEQIGEMSKVITKLREEKDGKLEQSNHHDTV